MHFAAFISYRHADPDQRWATWLHRKLETYRVPKGISAPQVGTKRIGRVFRDKEELAASSDLSTAIKEALDRSEYLIVICSPAAASSKYVNQEIREFASLGRQNKVLALLVEGEPGNAFPPALSELAHEPLAADVRNNTASNRNQAALRLLAPILNCGFDDLRQRERQRTKRRIQLIAFTAAACVLLTLGIRYGIYRLSLEKGSIETYDLIVKHGLNFMEPLLGSSESHIEVSDKLTEVSPNGQAPFARGSSVFFPANKDRLFRWLNEYYLEELRLSPNKKADVSAFFLEQLRVNDQASEDELVKALKVGSPAAYEVVVAHRLTAESFRTTVEKAFEDPEPKAKALSLNVLHELYGDDSRNHALTEEALKSCDAKAVKVAKALSYDPDLALLSRCAATSISEKRWGDFSILVVRFQLLHSVSPEWLASALGSPTPEEFQAAADIAMGLNINDPATVASLSKRLSDSNEKVKTAAALALWNIGADGDLVRQRVREMIVRDDNNQPPLSNYVALYRSSLSDDEVTRGLEKQLTGVGAGDFTGGWLVAGPDAVDVISHLKTKGTADVCLSEEKKARPEDYAQAILTARAVMLGCRERSVLTSLDSYVRTGVPGLLGSMIDPKVSEAYGSMLVEGERGKFEDGLERLWGLLRSRRSESSANYRLAVQYGIAKLVVRATSDLEVQARHLGVMEKLKTWANDEAPHHRAAFVNVSKLIREATYSKSLLPLKTQF